jgi:hypothetical protein
MIPSNSSRRWSVIAAGLLIFAIALVVIYAGSNAFHSPLAAVVLAAIGLAAVLLQLRLREDSLRALCAVRRLVKARHEPLPGRCLRSGGMFRGEQFDYARRHAQKPRRTQIDSRSAGLTMPT